MLPLVIFSMNNTLTLTNRDNTAVGYQALMNANEEF